MFQWPIVEHFPQSGVPGGSGYTLRPWFAAKVDMQGRMVAARLFWPDDYPGWTRNAAVQWVRQGTIPGVVTYGKAPSVQGWD